MTDTTPLDLDAIQERADGTTPGPWGIDEIPETGECRVIYAGDVDGNPATVYGITSGGSARDEAEFIAHARQDVPALVAEVRRLRGLVGAGDDPNVDTCWAVVLDSAGSADLYDTREEADAARAGAPDTGLDYIVTTTVIPAPLEEDPR